MSKIKLATNNITNIKKAKKLKDRSIKEQTKIINLSVWSGLNGFIESIGLDENIKGGLVILQTNDDDIRSCTLNLSKSDVIATVEEFKSRYYLSKFFGDLDEEYTDVEE